MRREQVRALLAEVASGRVSVESALGRLDTAPFETMPFASIDHHRALRHGYPEVVFGSGKRPEQVVAICERIAARSERFLVTRADAELRIALRRRFPDAIENGLARSVRWAAPRAGAADPAASRIPEADAAGTKRQTLIVTAGTSDLPVAEEAAETLAALDLCVTRLTDVGVAGIHRLLAQQQVLHDADAVIVVAGMDGALPSVIGGLVRVPVIAVPTSVGYGASFGGLSALLTMLNSCAAGVLVCNIDNGFGAAMAAARIHGA
jgi:hypothetical protein